MADRPSLADVAWAVRDYVTRVWDGCQEDNVFFMAGGIAFDLLLAAIPFSLLILTGFTYVLPRLSTANPADAAHQFLGSFLPAASGVYATLVYSLVDDVLKTRGRVTIYSAVLFAWLSTRLFASLRTGLAEVFDIDRERNFIRGKIFDLQMTIVATILFAISQVISGYLVLGTTRSIAALADMGVRQDFLSGFGEFVGRVLGFSVITLLFFALYKFLPIRRVRTRTALIAATFTGVGFELAKWVFKSVVLSLSVNSLYTGTIAAAAIIVSWVYYSAVIFLVGGEVGQVYELKRTRRLQTT